MNIRIGGMEGWMDENRPLIERDHNLIRSLDQKLWDEEEDDKGNGDNDNDEGD